jgi:acetate kinase
VVHGGGLQSSCLIDDEVEARVRRATSLAPLHNPTTLCWIRACRDRLGRAVPQVAAFDTAFFSALPPAAATYALPRDLIERHGLRRTGFHGLAHRSLWESWRAVRPDLPDGGRVVTVQLGSGCSVAAIAAGEPKDTSMGFTALEGLVMATRSGDVDAGVLTYLQKREGWPPEKVEEVLYKASGLLGLSGTSGDVRTLLREDSSGARAALDLYVHRARKHLAAMIAVLGGADGVVFGGGVGENVPAARWMILRDMAWCGIRLEEAANDAATGGPARISALESRVEARVASVDEGTLLAREAFLALAPAAA